jgi:hypothetical protein
MFMATLRYTGADRRRRVRSVRRASSRLCNDRNTIIGGEQFDATLDDIEHWLRDFEAKMMEARAPRRR